LKFQQKNVAQQDTSSEEESVIMHAAQPSGGKYVTTNEAGNG
jgi:hypothetical protein